MTISPFITYLPLPVRHGMTLGELARLFNAEKNIGAQLACRHHASLRADDVVRPDRLCLGCRRHPTCASSSEAVLCPGVGMIEAANVSVGRGTDDAPSSWWVRPGSTTARALTDHPRMARRIAGCGLKPRSSRREWVYPGQKCEGVRIVLTDRNRLDSPLLGVELMAALWRLYSDRPRSTARSAAIGSRASLAAVKALVDPRDVAQSWTPGVAEFLAKRQRIFCIEVLPDRGPPGPLHGVRAGLEARGPAEYEPTFPPNVSSSCQGFLNRKSIICRKLCGDRSPIHLRTFE